MMSQISVNLVSVTLCLWFKSTELETFPPSLWATSLISALFLAVDVSFPALKMTVVSGVGAGRGEPAPHREAGSDFL